MIFRTALGICTALAFASPAFAALVVSKAPTSNVSCASGVCTATAAGAVLNEKDFKHMLGAADLTLVSGGAAQDIVFNSKIQWVTTHRLTVDAFRGITFQLELASEGGGGVTLTTDDGGSGGALAFVQKGKLTFWDISSSLIINGVTHILANDIGTMAAQIAANPSGAFALGRGYDASLDGTYALAPIRTAFSGTLNGLGHAIANLKIQNDRRSHGFDGLFETIAAGGRVSDLSFIAASVISNGRGSRLGILASSNAGTVENVSADGAVSMGARFGNAGGLVGSNTGAILHSHSSGTVAAPGVQGNAAGLVAQNSGTVGQSSSSATVTGNYEVCGLVANNSGTVTQSFATGAASIQQIENSDHWSAGLVCINTGAIGQSFATGNVQAAYGKEGESSSFTAFGGGLVGHNELGATIQDSYSTGSVDAQGNDAIGGLVGQSSGTIETSYATGAVTAAPLDGGLIGDFEDGGDPNTDAYWDTDKSGVTNLAQGTGNVANAPGITGLSTVQLQSGLPGGFSSAVWGENAGINGGLPYLIANPPLQ